MKPLTTKSRKSNRKITYDPEITAHGDLTPLKHPTRTSKKQLETIEKIEMKTIKINKKVIASFAGLIKNINKVADKELVDALKLKRKDRTEKDIQKIVNYLVSTKLANKINFETKTNNNETALKIIISLAYFIKILSFNKNEFVFYQGDQPNYFYIIVEGMAEVLKDEQSIIRMTPSEYLKALVDIQESTNDIKLIEKTIKVNVEVYNFEFKYIKIVPALYKSLEYIKECWTLIHLKELSKDLLINNLTKVEELLNISLEETLGTIIDNNLVSEDDFANALLTFHKLIYSSKEFSTYSYYFENNNHLVRIPKRVQVNRLIKDDIFGDFAIQETKERSASIRAITPTLTVGIISSMTYKEYISNEASRFENKKIQLLNEKYYFKSIQRQVFIQKYYSNFTLKIYQKGDLLFKENDTINKVYLILNGTVHLKINKSIMNLFELYKNVLENLKNINLHNSQIKQINSLSRANAQLLNKIKNHTTKYNEKKVNDYLNQIRNLSLIKYTNYSVIGSTEIYFCSKVYFSQCEVISDKLEVFEINYHAFTQILDDDTSTMSYFNNFEYSKLLTFLQRIDSIKSTYLNNEEYNNMILKTDNNPFYSDRSSNINKKINMKIFSFSFNKEALELIGKARSKIKEKTELRSKFKIKEEDFKAITIFKNNKTIQTKPKLPKTNRIQTNSKKLSLLDNINSFFVTSERVNTASTYNSKYESFTYINTPFNRTVSNFSKFSYNQRNPLEIVDNISSQCFIICDKSLIKKQLEVFRNNTNYMNSEKAKSNNKISIRLKKEL